MKKEDFERIEKEELELAEQRAIARKRGDINVTSKRRIFQNLIKSGVFINPREERLRRLKHH